MEVATDVKDFVAAHKGLFAVLENGKIQCTLTSHELPARVQVLEAHMQGKKYRKLLAAKEIQIPDKFKEYLVEHAKKPNKLYCLLTERAINRTQEEVDRHLHGYRFCKRFAKKTAGETVVGEAASRSEVGEREEGGAGENKEEAEEMWVPPEYLGREKKAKKRVSRGKAAQSGTDESEESEETGSEAEAVESEDDQEVEAVIKTVLVKAPSRRKGAKRAAQDAPEPESDTEVQEPAAKVKPASKPVGGGTRGPAKRQKK